MDLSKKLQLYNIRYKFLDPSKKFNFYFSPERIIYRNYAMIHQQEQVYRDYLALKYPDYLSSELAKFELDISTLERISRVQFELRYTQNEYCSLVETDLHVLDVDSICVVRNEVEAERARLLKHGLKEMIYNYAPVEVICGLRDFFWVRK